MSAILLHTNNSSTKTLTSLAKGGTSLPISNSAEPLTSPSEGPRWR
jgi:hypothetical protein